MKIISLRKNNDDVFVQRRKHTDGVTNKVCYAQLHNKASRLTCPKDLQNKDSITVSQIESHKPGGAREGGGGAVMAEATETYEEKTLTTILPLSADSSEIPERTQHITGGFTVKFHIYHSEYTLARKERAPRTSDLGGGHGKCSSS